MITTERLEGMDADLAEITATLRQRRQRYLAELEAELAELEAKRDWTNLERVMRRAVDYRAELSEMDLKAAHRAREMA